MATELERDRSIIARLEKLSPDKRAAFETLLSRRASAPGAAMLDGVRTVPLSSAQQRLWFLEQLTPNTPFYTVDLAFRITAAVDTHAFRRALNEIVRRHEILRTSFADRDGTPVQVVHPHLDLACPVLDLRHLPEEEREQEATRLAVDEAKRPFDLRRAPLLRTSLIQLHDEAFLFLFNVHHIVADGWSLQVFSQELTSLYGAFQAGLESPLPELPLQFADYAEWEREFLRDGATEQLAYWKRALADLPVLHLPTDHPRPALPAYRGLRHFIAVSQSITRALDALAREERVTLYATVLAAFEILLHRYSGQDEIVLGTPVAGRSRANTEGLIGCFINALVIRVDLSGDPTFREALHRVSTVVVDALAHQNVALETLVDELKVRRDLSRNPLFQVTFQVFQSPGDSGPASKPLIVQKGTTQMDIALDLFQSPAGLSGTLEYSTELFEPATIERMCGHFQVLLEAIADDPGRRISQLPLLTHGERRQILDQSNETGVQYECDGSVDYLVSEQAARTPAAAAVRDGRTQLTYAELEARSDHLATALCGLGVTRQSLVGLFLERSIDSIAAVLAVLKAGGAYVALDPAYPRERLEFLLRDSNPVLVVSTEALAGAIPSDAVRVLLLDAVPEMPAELPPPRRANSDDPAYVVYTSGSTGQPKGVIVSHGALRNHMLWWRDTFPLRAGERMLHKYSLSFDVATLEIFAPLLAGAEIVVAPPGAEGDIDALVNLIATEDIAAIDVVPSQLALLADHRDFVRCTNLHRITCGGEAMPADLAERILTHAIDLYNVYGPTEATISATYWKCRPGEQRHSVPIGRPIANMRAYIVDRYGNSVPIGVPGELLLGGAGLANGYLNRPELTREKFIRDPFDRRPGALAYRTGDRARYLPDGNIEFLGRLDHQVKVRGFRIETGEIEAALASHPSVESCAVVAHTSGNGDTRLVAYAVPARQPELWPSVGEYGLYDAVMYHAMTHDERRNERYQTAIQRLVPGKIVLDVGTGADALLARYCAEAGASRVYAIEMLDDSFAAAGKLIAQLRLGDRVRLIHGDAMNVELPEKVDVCVSELFGMIASSEGAVSILNSARRFLKQGGVMIPVRAATRIAAVSLPDALRTAPAFTRLSGPYADKIFAAVGYPFDVRICIDNARKSWLVSDTGLLESLEFTRPVRQPPRRGLNLTVLRDARIDGFMAWLTAETVDGVVIDALEQEYHWLPVYCPAFSPPLAVRQGDTITASCEVTLPAGSIMPDYRVRGSVTRDGKVLCCFDYDSPHSRPVYKSNDFYAALFRDDYRARYSEPASQLDLQQLRSHLARTLPEFMIPAKFVSLPAMPLTAGGKVDRQQLPLPDRGSAEANHPRRRAGSQTEREIAAIWQELLEVDEVGVDENFFDAGGHSLLIVRVQSRIRERLSVDVPIVDLFRYPTIAALAEFISGTAAFAGGFTT